MSKYEVCRTWVNKEHKGGLSHIPSPPTKKLQLLFFANSFHQPNTCHQWPWVNTRLWVSGDEWLGVHLKWKKKWRANFDKIKSLKISVAGKECKQRDRNETRKLLWMFWKRKYKATRKGKVTWEWGQGRKQGTGKKHWKRLLKKHSKGKV